MTSKLKLLEEENKRIKARLNTIEKRYRDLTRNDTESISVCPDCESEDWIYWSKEDDMIHCMQCEKKDAFDEIDMLRRNLNDLEPIECPDCGALVYKEYVKEDRINCVNCLYEKLKCECYDKKI